MPIIHRENRGYPPILHGRSRNYFWEGKGALSIKTFKNGRAFYQAGRGHFAVEEGNYLLLNHGQEYSITIESEVPVESFCIFFPERMVEEVYHSITASNEQLLDDPVFPKPMSVDFVEKTYRDKWLSAKLFQIKSDYPDKYLEATWMEEHLYELAQGLLNVHRQIQKEVMKLQSLRASTREELYKRIHIGHEFLCAYFDQSITLMDVARAAYLSPNHFLRSYKQLFGISPYQYLIERRLQESQRLLLQTDRPITDICLSVGFQSPSSFSSLFSKRFSMTPTQFRQKR
ncbi:helix-turn-helix transcriptional regulator [Cohnella sp. REN36]|uniref:helix-turn-helix transcriptional regulator n=1 Tax=Cohnella sp. REN36 TaxID=2887347 RepID=UPI001D13CA5B|nr:helix-turn-helix transcriptional regulator [Cohnella sp. REN36]MCC3377118.1 helix-turn-helix transcriptional regulator [Cohnella sp. REN36]